ncbi:MAG: hydantoinase/oxoprolinase family protein [Acidobacteriota bacterium]
MRVAIDTGGTFTDILLYDQKKSKLWPLKLPSTPRQPEKALLEGLSQVFKLTGSDVSLAEAVIHGSTLVTNSLLERKTAKTGLLVTEGFRDLLEIGRQDRPELYNLQVERRPPLVPRHLVMEIAERIRANGQVVKKLDLESARKNIQSLKQEGVESLAISLLFSFLNPEHEKKLYQLAEEFFPSHFIFLSCRISPEFREYERTSTTTVAAAVAPLVTNYLLTIFQKLKENGWKKPDLFIMHSGGGMLPSDEAAKHPHVMVESGPAAGIMAASRLSRLLRLPRVIAFDMGGTTAKAGLILQGKPQYTTDYQVGGDIHRGGRSHGGYPVRFPMIDVAECGAGSGSIAWIDPGGHLQVGPQSAGAEPGPACYGRGGRNPTVTDAYIVLGYLGENDLLGGKMALHPKKAEAAVGVKTAGPLGIGIKEAARGILTVVNSNMLNILRLVSVSQGYDPRDFTLIAFGGSGPLLATPLAEEMNIRRVVIPCYPGLFSAVGLLSSDVTLDFTKTKLIQLNKKTLPSIRQTFLELRQQAEKWFQEGGVPEKKKAYFPSADLRYVGQNFELSIPLPDENFSLDELESLASLFHKAHKKTYGHSDQKEPIQVVNLRLRAVRKVKKPGFPQVEKAIEPAEKAQEEQRRVWLSDIPGKQKAFSALCPVYRRDKLKAGHEIEGPALIKEFDSTTFIGPSWQLLVDSYGNFIIERIGGN